MLKNRPAAFLCLVFSAGTAAGLFFGSLSLIIISAVLLAASAVLYKRTLKTKLYVIFALAAIFFLVGGAYMKLFAYASTPTLPEADVKYSFTAAVRDTVKKSRYTLVEAEVQDALSPFDGEIFETYIYTDDVPKAGEVIALTGKVKLGDNYNRANGVSYVVTGEYTHCPDKSPEGFYFKVLKLRQRVGEFIDASYGGEAAAFYKAILVGDRSELSTEFYADFSRSGLSHIMAISGQHFSIIIFGVYRVLMALLQRKKLCSGIAIVLAVGYTIFAGASPSIVRAAFMCCVVYVTAVFNEESDPLINLSVALVVILLFNPYAILNISLQLSFLATMGIIFIIDQLDRFYQTHKTPRLAQLLLEPAFMSITSSLFCTPVFISRFDYISLLSPLSNFLVNWLVSATMICGILLLPLAFLIKEIAIIPRLLYLAINGVASWISGMPYACVSVDVPYIWLLILPSLAIIIGFAAFRPKRGILVFCASFLSAMLIVFGCLHLQGRDYKNNSLLSVKDGGSVSYAFYTDGERTVLVDGSGALSVSDTVTAHGYTYLDAYVITACTQKSAARFKATIPYTPVYTVYIPGVDNEYAYEIIGLASDNACRIVRYDDNCLDLGDLTVHTPQTEESGYSIKLENDDGTLIVLGNGSYVESFSVSECDALIITNAFTESNNSIDNIPTHCNKAYIYNAENGGYYEYVTRNGISKDVELYTGDVVIRFGVDGVKEEQ